MTVRPSDVELQHAVDTLYRDLERTNDILSPEVAHYHFENTIRPFCDYMDETFSVRPLRGPVRSK